MAHGTGGGGKESAAWERFAERFQRANIIGNTTEKFGMNKGMEWTDIFAIVAAIITTVPSMMKVWGMRKPVTVAAGVRDDFLLMPLLHVREVNFPLARRLQSWQFSVILHSFTAILCIWKDDHTTAARYIGPGILLVTGILQLGYLLWHYPVIQDVFTTGINICLGCWFYLLVVFTDVVYFKDSHISITLEILLIYFTVCMHAFRFVSQDSYKFNWLRLTIAGVGCIPGILTLFKLHDLFSKPDTMLLMSNPDPMLDLIVDGHIMFKVSTIIGSLFRFLDVIFICVPVTREATNYFLGKVQECFNHLW